MSFTCQVCFEQQTLRFPLPELKTGNGDVLRAKDCGHPICQACLATFVSTRVSEQLVFGVRCPFVGCSNELFEQDVQRLASAGALAHDVSDRFAELRARDFTARAASLSDTFAGLEEGDDYSLILKLWQTTRLCPRCSLVIEKSQGCNSFYCICGHHFHYDSAPRVVGNGIQKFDQLVEVACQHNMSLKEVQQYGGECWRRARALAWIQHVKRTAAETRLPQDQAWELLQQAKLGDKAAREKIRLARNAARKKTQLDQGGAAVAIEVGDHAVLEVVVTTENSIRVLRAEQLRKVSEGVRKNAYVKSLFSKYPTGGNESQ